jgi:hypothetical protein
MRGSVHRARLAIGRYCAVCVLRSRNWHRKDKPVWGEATEPDISVMPTLSHNLLQRIATDVQEMLFEQATHSQPEE